MSIYDVLKQPLAAGDKVVYTAGGGTLEVGTLEKISSGKIVQLTYPLSNKTPRYRGGPGYIIVSGVKLKLSKHKTFNSLGDCCIDRVVKIR